MEVIYRALSHADFYNMYKPSGSEETGGGQTYIDFPISKVSISDWESFLDNITGVEKEKNPSASFEQIVWHIPLKSIGFEEDEPQRIKIYRRREPSISIAAQTLNRRSSNRVNSWLPINGFPEPADITNRHSCPPSLTVFLLKSGESIVAGWILPKTNEGSDLSKYLNLQEFFKNLYEGNRLFESACGYKELPDIQETNIDASINITEDTLEKTLLEEDIYELTHSPNQEESHALHIAVYRQRNTKIVRALKRLYGGKCQITGVQCTFLLPNGQYYSEAHHLIPLGKGGSDTPNNIIIISPLIHRMLHYCNVAPIDFSNLHDNKLTILIEEKEYSIVYNPHHAELIKKIIG